ncbi:MAG: class I SAM-dependent methyltransferase [Leptospiraceae bacterium]|nr:class I SAM-dependent methyltransferase [Leptospiraceae bacterium]
MKNEYIHTYEESEQQRLVAQAEFLAPYTHPFLSFEPTDSILEIGCGVGAQMKIILEKRKLKKLTGIDLEPKQIEKAKTLLYNQINQGKVELTVGSGINLPYADGSFDVVYIFFVLEHFIDPKSILKEIKRVLKPNGKFYCTEVFNAGTYIYPDNPFLVNYWKKFNDLQTAIGGNPHIGIELSNLCIDSGFIIDKFVSTAPLLDKRMIDSTERKRFLNMWETLFLSGYSMLYDRGIINKEDNKLVSLEFEKILVNPNSIFLYTCWQVLAINQMEQTDELPYGDWKD